MFQLAWNIMKDITTNHGPYAKVSRLPAAVRNQVNQMLYDGLSYSHIIAWLQQQGHPAEQQRNKPPRESLPDEKMEHICDKFNLK